MQAMYITWFAIAVSLLCLGVIAKEIAKSKGRDEYIYLGLGIVLGPFALIPLAVPLPGERGKEKPQRRVHKLEDKICPGCGKQVSPLEKECPYCGESLELRWWERETFWG